MKPQKHFFAWFSIRAQLLFLLLAIAAFLTIDRAREFSAEKNNALERARHEIFSTAQRGAQREAELVASAKAALTLAARDPTIREDAPRSCHAPFGEAMETLAWLDSLSLINKAGGVICTTTAQVNARGVGDRPYFQEVLSTKTFVVSDLLTSRLTNRPVVNVVLPKLDSVGEVVSVFLASIDADWFTRVTRAASGIETADVMLLNAAGNVIATSTRLPHWVGKNLTGHTHLWMELNGLDGVVEDDFIDGVPNIMGHIRLPSTRGILIVMRSRHDILSQVNKIETIALAKIVLTGALCLLAVWIGGQIFVLRPLTTLGAAAKKLGEGNLDVRVPTRALAPELGTLGEAFNAMSALLARREGELQQANVRLSGLAATDGLTGLANKRHFEEQLDAEWRRACRGGQPLAVIALDVDHFKKFNDRYGHLAGDECLQRVAGVLKRACRRPGDLAARIGGEEFVVLLPGAQIEDAVAIAESVRLAFRTLRIPHEDSAAGHVTASIGVASFVPHVDQPKAELLNAADEALYRAKRNGRNRVVMHQPRVALAS